MPPNGTQASFPQEAFHGGVPFPDCPSVNPGAGLVDEACRPLGPQFLGSSYNLSAQFPSL